MPWLQNKRAHDVSSTSISSCEDLPASLADLEKSHTVFTELLELKKYEDGWMEWKEKARWIKYEEHVQTEGDRWSKPHVSTPSLQGWLALRQHLRTGLVMVDLDPELKATSGFGKGPLHSVCEQIAAELVRKNFVSSEVASRLKDLWLRKHRHQFEGPRKTDGKLTAVIKELLTQKLEKQKGGIAGRKASSLTTSRRGSTHLLDDRETSLPIQKDKDLSSNGKVNVAFQKKIPGNTEAAIILVGVVGFLEKPISVFVRLKNPTPMADLPEVDIPTRFFYFFTAPVAQGSPEGGPGEFYDNIGVSLATAFSDKQFLKELYSARKANEILEAFDDYTHGLKVLPRNWDTDQKIEPPKNVRKKLIDELEEIDEDRRMREASGLMRTGRLFGGLINDMKRKKGFYISDFLHGLHPQCISSFLFIYFATLAPTIAFGGLLGEATENRIATIESLISGMISIVIFGLFAGQPLVLLGSTGPVYVFERILYQMCSDQNWDYLSLRLWIGLWVAAILMVLVAIDASAYVCYITRFTEELFATLVAFIFIFNAFNNLVEVGLEYKFSPSSFENSCKCDHFNLSRSECLKQNATYVGSDCDYEANVFLMSLVLFVGVFTISFSLKQFRTTGYLPGSIRDFLGNFAVVIGILSMTALDYFSGVKTPKLEVPSSIKPTWEGRDWVVSHALIFPEHILSNPWWVDVFLAPVFAVLATILIFMDQQITAVIVNRKDHKLIKGGGYHLDLAVLAVTIVICSVFGLPWFVAATVTSINHLQSLAKESQVSVPGEKPEFLGIREQRVTAVLIGLCIGLSTLITPVLALIPMPVLFGVFLFMGVSSLRGLQFFDRLLLLLIPRKYQPEYVYLKFVPLHRVHIFTAIQLAALVGLWLIKNHPQTSISFPVMLVVICCIRKLIECIFSKRELRLLDDLLPESDSKKRRHHHRQESVLRRLSTRKKDWDDEGKEVEIIKDIQAAELEVQARIRQRAQELRYELETISKQNQPEKERRKRVAQTSPKRIPNSDGRKFVIFAKLSTQDVFTPIHLHSNKSIEDLLSKLEQKFDDFKAMQVSQIFMKTKKNLLFHFDDDMMYSVKANDIFDIELSEAKGKPSLYNMTLVEV